MLYTKGGIHLNKVTVTIGGAEYTLTAPETPEYMKRCAAYVDKNINSMMFANRKLSALQATVLTAVNYCDENTKLQTDNANLRAKLKEALDDYHALRTEQEETVRQLTDLRNELGKALAELDALKKKTDGE